MWLQGIVHHHIARSSALDHRFQEQEMLLACQQRKGHRCHARREAMQHGYKTGRGGRERRSKIRLPSAVLPVWTKPLLA